MKEPVCNWVRSNWVTVTAVAAVAVIILLGIIGARRVSVKKRSDNICSMIVSQSRKISELTTKEYLEDMILFDTEFNGIRTDTVAVLVVRGKVRAGIDLSKLKAEDIRISGDSATVALPEPEILDILINPSDIEVFYSAKGWDSARRTPVLIGRGKSNLRSKALESGILEKANDSAARFFEDLLRSSGFSSTIITEKAVPQNDLRLPDAR